MSTVLSFPVGASPPHVSPPYSFIRLPILFGPLCGYHWIPASGGKMLRILLGTYEREQSALFQELIGPGSRVLDIGAANGYYTLLAAQLAGASGRVISFEPDRINAAYLREHVALNGLENVSVHEWAIGEFDGRMGFGAGTGSGTGHLCVEGDREVRVRRLDDLFSEESFAPTHIKIDVEGAELAVLLGGERVIRRARPTIFLSTHDEIVHAECCELLADWGYTLAPILGNDVRMTTEVLAVASL